MVATGPIALIHVVAVAENGVIGVDGGLPWRIRADLQRFRAITMGKPLLMGRSTYESIGRPLDGRDNIVLTRRSDFAAPDIVVAHDLLSALAIGEEKAAARGASEMCVIGGGALFMETLPLAARLHVSHVEGSPHGDVFFPAIAEAEWKVVSREPLPQHESDTARATYVLYERRA